MKITYRIEYALARACLALLRAMPPAAASDFGGFLARAIGPLLPPTEVAYANLKVVMPELDAAARRRVVRGVWENLGRTIGELPHLANLRRDTPSGPGFEVRNEEIIRRIAAQGGPAVFCSAHIGNWEFLPVAVASVGLPFGAVYRAAANPLIDQLIRQLRAAVVAQDQPLFSKGAAGARRAMAHIARGGRLGLVVDQKMNDGIEARLFGLPAMTAPAAAAFALRVRCPVVCGHVERLGPARLCLVAEEPLELPDTGDRQADIALLTQRINDQLEGWIRARPESWLWLHRRWGKDVVPVKQRKKASAGAA
jgi:KDO2-lipid IV(A) lauroyltransferase